MNKILYDWFLRFYDRATDLPLSSTTITQEMANSLQISADYSVVSTKTITMELKNPNNIFASDSPNPNGENIFGDTIVTDWSAYMVPDAKFFIAKGSPADFDAADDTDKQRRLIGIFRIDDVNNDMIGQKVTIKGRDEMKYMQVAVAYTYPDPFKYPPPNWAEECKTHTRTWSKSALMSVGQIVHDIFHRMDVWHLHKTGGGTPSNDSFGSLWDDGTIFWSTNMFFDAANSDYSDEQIFNLVHPYDFISKFSDYTGYKFYVKDTIVSGVPRPVFVFRNPEYTDDTSGLFGTSDILYYNQSSLPYHRYPLMTLAINYRKSDNEVRGYIFVATKDDAVIVENTGDSGQNMDWKRWRIGVVVEPSITNVSNISYAKGIAQSIMAQSMHKYRDMNITMNDFIKFGNNIYNFAIQLTEPYIHINALYLCRGVTWTWQDGNAFTTASFDFYANDAYSPPVDTPSNLPIEILLTGEAGNGICHLQWSQVQGTNAYWVLRDGITRDTIVPTNNEPIVWDDTTVTNGTRYMYQIVAFFIVGTSKTSNPLYLTPTNGKAGGGGGVKYNV